MQCYFSVNKLTTDVQHAYRDGHSTCTDDWLKEIDNKKIVGAVLLDFSATFDIVMENFPLVIFYLDKSAFYVCAFLITVHASDWFSICNGVRLLKEESRTKMQRVGYS
jgi:hypothetical protein